ncbi:hypothetical protein K438DRAFT_1758086 [Mycena galopus ATCC 62051]|nr:hypothetical protein K438DRAFT_1758086 [Mycena galopus ATCC 62051]
MEGKNNPLHGRDGRVSTGRGVENPCRSRTVVKERKWPTGTATVTGGSPNFPTLLIGFRRVYNGHVHCLRLVFRSWERGTVNATAARRRPKIEDEVPGVKKAA